MEKKIYSILFISLFFFSTLNVKPQDPGISLSSNYIGYFEKQVPRKAEKEFQFIAYFINQGISSNFYPENVFMRGQVIGRMFGDNTTRTTDTLTSVYFEQRIIPFFVYQPKLFNGKATLRASFEIDWTWGDVAYSTGGNLGGAISSDQVNIQTQNIVVEYQPSPGWTINLGMQRLFDTPYDTYRTFFEKMSNTGYRLMYWGTDAVGIKVNRSKDFSRWSFAYYQLYENKIEADDDVTLQFVTYETDLLPKWKAGASVHYIRDRSSGDGGVSIYGQGPTSRLTEYNGTFRFRFTEKSKTDVVWLGGFFSRNADFMMDRFRLTGFANYNIGKLSLEDGDGWKNGADIGGLGANLKLGYRYGQTTEDIFDVDFIFATGDQDALNDNKYSGVITGNTWGAPAGIFISSGSYIIFPHGNVVNRFTPLVADLSNMGYGMTGTVLNASRAFVPNRFSGKIGTAWAMSNATPKGGGQQIATELNAALKYQIGVYMSFELHGAYAWLGDFYDSNSDTHSFYVNGSASGERPLNPWTAFIVYKWLMF